MIKDILQMCGCGIAGCDQAAGISGLEATDRQPYSVISDLIESKGLTPFFVARIAFVAGRRRAGTRKMFQMMEPTDAGMALEIMGVLAVMPARIMGPVRLPPDR
ncbi:MAG: hypothetical protein WBN65_07365 [Gammaproteobacteria bacterium]